MRDLETAGHSVHFAAAGGEHIATVELVMATEFGCIQVPEPVSRELEIEPVKRLSLDLADGRQVEMELCTAWVTLDGKRLRMTMLAEPAAPFVFGLFSREALGLDIEPPEGEPDPPPAERAIMGNPYEISERSRLPSKEIGRQGRAMYEQEIRHLVEADHDGEYVAIDVDSREWVLAGSERAAVDRLKEMRPDAINILLELVGFRALRSFGAGPLRDTK